jgi:hypothetical protein
LKAFRRKYCLGMEYEDKENVSGRRYVKGNFKLRTKMTATEVRTLLGFTKLYLKGERERAAPPARRQEEVHHTIPVVVVIDNDENPLLSWLKTRPSVGSVAGSLLRSVMRK